jgi:hypothetical protein
VRRVLALALAGGLLVCWPAVASADESPSGCGLPVLGQVGDAVDSVSPAVGSAVRQLVAVNCDPTSHPTTTSAVDGLGSFAGLDRPIGGLRGGLPVSLYRFGTVAMRNYGGVPAVAPGLFAPAPNQRYGMVPVGSIDLAGGADDDLTAGSALALDAGGFAGAVGMPLLLAVLALSGVTAALVRTWTSRRAPGR